MCVTHFAVYILIYSCIRFKRCETLREFRRLTVGLGWSWRQQLTVNRQPQQQVRFYRDELLYAAQKGNPHGCRIKRVSMFNQLVKWRSFNVNDPTSTDTNRCNVFQMGFYEVNRRVALQSYFWINNIRLANFEKFSHGRLLSNVRNAF